MTGESPGRPEQQKTSGEPTPGEPDPQATASADPRPTGRAGERGDRATMLLGVPGGDVHEAGKDSAPEPASDARSDVASGTEAPSGAAVEAELETERSSRAADVRLKNGVAAWVAKANSAKDGDRGDEPDPATGEALDSTDSGPERPSNESSDDISDPGFDQSPEDQSPEDQSPEDEDDNEGDNEGDERSHAPGDDSDDASTAVNASSESSGTVKTTGADAASPARAGEVAAGRVTAVDSGVDDSAAVEAATGDSGVDDSAAVEVATGDSGVDDSAAVEVATVDSGVDDSHPQDSGAAGAEPADSAADGVNTTTAADRVPVPREAASADNAGDVPGEASESDAASTNSPSENKSSQPQDATTPNPEESAAKRSPAVKPEPEVPSPTGPEAGKPAASQAAPFDAFEQRRDERPRIDQPTTLLKRPTLPDTERTGGTGGTDTTGGADETDGTDEATPADPHPTTALRRPRLPGSEGTTDPKAGAKPDPKAGAKPGRKTDPDPRIGFGTGSGRGADSKAGSKPESAPERTSTFVPLRRDDQPSVGQVGQVGQVGTSASSRPAWVDRTTAASAPAESDTATTSPGGQAAPGKQQQAQQQPKPPLDLLAELTNTPPPPQTPVRSIVRRFKIWTPLVVLLFLVFMVVQTVRPLPSPTLSMTRATGFTFAGGPFHLPFPDEGQGGVQVEGIGTIGFYGAQKPAPIASVAKTMTAYVILRDHPLTGRQAGPKITVDEQAAKESDDPDQSTAPLSLGQRFTEKQLLQLLMIPSGNNAARLLARWDSGTEAAFVRKMNAAAKDLGMTHTTYTDPSGLESSTTSVPADQLALAKAAMRNDVFRGIVNTPQINIPGIDNTIYNNNPLLLDEGVSGIKTGSSTPAGGNLLWAADTVVDGKSYRILGIVMGIQKADTLFDKLTLATSDSGKLIKAAQTGVVPDTVVQEGEVIGSVADGLGGTTPVVATKDLKAVGWSGLRVAISLRTEAGGIPHSAKAGTVVGSLSIGSGAVRTTVPIALQRALVEPGFGAKLTRLG